MGPLKTLKIKVGSLLLNKREHSSGCPSTRMKFAVGANLGFGLCSVSNHQALQVRSQQKVFWCVSEENLQVVCARTDSLGDVAVLFSQVCCSLPSSTSSKSSLSFTTRKTSSAPVVKAAAQVPCVSEDSTRLVDPIRAGLLKQDPLQSLVEKRDLRENVGADSVHDQYSFGEEIGRGTYGVVYSAVEIATGMDVAIKKVPTSGLARRSSFSAVKKEAEVMKKLQDCISAVQYRAFFENEDDVEKAQEGKYSFIAMEYCGGGDLQSLMEV